MKTKTTFFCNNCGYESAKWLGKCPVCNSWNTFREEVISKSTKNDQPSIPGPAIEKMPRPLSAISSEKDVRKSTNDQELDRVLGGGIVPGSLVLIGGEPGIGKSTLMLQIALQNPEIQSLYISGEESENQIKVRAGRLMTQLHDNCLILAETNMNRIMGHLKNFSPDLIIVDSIQTMYSDYVESVPGSLSQVRQCAADWMRYSKDNNVPVFLVGHITKDGNLAGPKVLEHMVDTVLQFEGDRHMAYRILRTSKNRFGSTAELGIYEMSDKGLRQISNPSEILISQKDAELSGMTIGATLEGRRPLLIETQALVSGAAYGTPQRTSTGFDTRRLNMIIAVLEKRAGFRISLHDVFINMAGGLKIEDPAIDLAIATAIVSSLEEIPVSDKACFAAELGLGGELRAVNQLEIRISEAARLGFGTIYISKFGAKELNTNKFPIKVKRFSDIRAVFADLFG